MGKIGFYWKFESGYSCFHCGTVAKTIYIDTKAVGKVLKRRTVSMLSYTVINCHICVNCWDTVMNRRLWDK